MKKLLFAIPLAFLMSCGGSDKPMAVSALETPEQELGYAFGSLSAEFMMRDLSANFESLNKDSIVAGFESNLNETDCSDCDTVMKSLFGPYFQDFNNQYADAGATCIGRMTGFSFYSNMKEMGALDKMDMDYLVYGFKQGLEKTDSLLSQEDKESLLQAFFTAENDKMYAGNKEEGTQFLATNKAKEGVITTASGLQYEIITEGSGPSPLASSEVTVHYHGTLIDGTVFDSSVDRGEPISFPLNRVIPGWTEGLQLMNPGAKYRFYIPQELAYGENAPQGSPIKPFMTLIFDVELISFK